MRILGFSYELFTFMYSTAPFPPLESCCVSLGGKVSSVWNGTGCKQLLSIKESKRLMMRAMMLCQNPLYDDSTGIINVLPSYAQHDTTRNLGREIDFFCFGMGLDPTSVHLENGVQTRAGGSTIPTERLNSSPLSGSALITSRSRSKSGFQNKYFPSHPLVRCIQRNQS